MSSKRLEHWLFLWFYLTPKILNCPFIHRLASKGLLWKVRHDLPYPIERSPRHSSVRNKTMLKSSWGRSCAKPLGLPLSLANLPDHHSSSSSTQSAFSDRRAAWASALLVGKDLHPTREMMRWGLVSEQFSGGLKWREHTDPCLLFLFVCLFRESSSPGYLQRVLQQELGWKWETNSWRWALAYSVLPFLPFSGMYSQSAGWSHDLSASLRWMGWTSTRRNTTQLWKPCEAPAPQFRWRCYGSIWWNQRTPSPPRRWGQKTTTSRGRDAAAAWPSTWSRPPADLSSDSPPAWSEMTRGWDSASPAAKAPPLTVQGTWWDSHGVLAVTAKQEQVKSFSRSIIQDVKVRRQANRCWSIRLVINCIRLGSSRPRRSAVSKETEIWIARLTPDRPAVARWEEEYIRLSGVMHYGSRSSTSAKKKNLGYPFAV